MNESEKAMRAADAMAAFVAANKGKTCRRCKAPQDEFPYPIDKRGYCPKCDAVRRASMVEPAQDELEKPAPFETTEKCNARLARNKQRVDERNKKVTPITPADLLRGANGRPQVSGVLLNHATNAVSLRASLAGSLTQLVALENFISANPACANAAWSNYVAIYSRFEGWARDVRHHEGVLKDAIPELHLEPIMLPRRIEQPATREWVEYA